MGLAHALQRDEVMNFARLLAWTLILVSALLSSPNVPAQAVATVRDILGMVAGRFVPLKSARLAKIFLFMQADSR
jgi:hypothetical protein